MNLESLQEMDKAIVSLRRWQEARLLRLPDDPSSSPCAADGMVPETDHDPRQSTAAAAGRQKQAEGASDDGAGNCRLI